MRRVVPVWLGALLIGGMSVVEASVGSHQAMPQFALRHTAAKTGGDLVTGGGWVQIGDGLPHERVTFGFTAGADSDGMPAGETEIQLHDRGTDFQSTSYDWLAISGGVAVWHGSGQLNRVPGFRFTVVAVDGKLDGTGVDKFWFTVKDAIGNTIVDTNPPVIPGALRTVERAVFGTPIPLSGGSIVIHGSRSDAGAGPVSDTRRIAPIAHGHLSA